MLARYIGKNGSLRYQRGKTYEIRTYVKQSFLWVNAKGIDTMDCPYETLEALLKNWEILNHNKDRNINLFELTGDEYR